jgi:5'-3' exonuclease
MLCKAMRDDEGNMIKNAHLIGTLRRILKLLFHHIFPVFVFDGATPTLKRQTVAARRRRRAETQVLIARVYVVTISLVQSFLTKKSTEKLLLAHIKGQFENKANNTLSLSANAAAAGGYFPICSDLLLSLL